MFSLFQADSASLPDEGVSGGTMKNSNDTDITRNTNYSLSNTTYIYICMSGSRRHAGVFNFVQIWNLSCSGGISD